MREKIEQCKERIAGMADAFYQGHSEEGNEKAMDVVESLLELSEEMGAAIEEGKMSGEGLEEFLGVLREAMDAMEQKDMVLFSDILQYDMTEQLDRLAGSE